MAILIEANDIVRAAEEKIRQLMGRASLAGDYDALVTLASWGKALGALVVQPHPSGVQRSVPPNDRGHTATNKQGITPAPTAKERLNPRRSDDSKNERRSHPPMNAATPAATPARRSNRANPTRKYPQFLRFGGDLIKVGWSKKLRTEYEHKSPKEVLDMLATTLATLGSDGRRFTMEEVLPHMKLQDGLDVPTYQTYLCLAWLRDAELLHQHGRQGYSVSTEEPLSEQVNSKWQDLPAKK